MNNLLKDVLSMFYKLDLPTSQETWVIVASTLSSRATSCFCDHTVASLFCFAKGSC